MAILPQTKVKFTGWDESKRSPDEILYISYLTPIEGVIDRQTHEHVYVVAWQKAEFVIGSEVASGDLLSEHWDSELEVIKDGENSSSNRGSESARGNDSEKDSSERESEGAQENLSETQPKDAYDFGPIKFDKNKSPNRKPGEELEAPEDYGDEVTGPIILTNHPEKWQVKELPDGKKFRWNGEIWIDIDPDDFVPKDEKAREEFFKDCPNEAEKHGQKYGFNRDAPEPYHGPLPKNPEETMVETERMEKYHYVVEKKKFKMRSDKTGFTTQSGAFLSNDQVKAQYETYRVQKILYERLRCILENNLVDKSTGVKIADLYKWFRENDFWTKKQTLFAGSLMFKVKSAIRQSQGAAYREIKEADNEWMDPNHLD